MPDDVFVAKLMDFEDGGRRLVGAGNRSVGIFRRGDSFFAYRNRCAHQGGPVCMGKVMPRVEAVVDADRQVIGECFSETETHLVCPWHGYEYDLESGVCNVDPALRLEAHEVVLRDGGVYVRV